MAVSINGNNQLFENNDISHTSDGINMLGAHNVLRKNTFHDNTSTDCGSNSSNCHIDFIQSEPNTPSGGSGGQNLNTQYNVIESNVEITNLGVNGHGFLTQGDYCGGQCFNVIHRFNQGAHVGGGGLLDDLGGFYNVKTYNDTWVDYNQATHSSSDITTHWKGNSYGGSAVNNIYYYPEALNGFNPVACEDTSCSPFNHSNNLAFCTGGCSGLFGYKYGTGSWLGDSTGNLLTDPRFVSYSSSGIGDLHLLAGSPALNAGTNLTTANGTGTNGTSLVVNDAAYFQDGYTIPGVNADCISLTTVSNHVCITAVNYSTNTLTLASPMTWASGDKIWLYSDSSGTVRLTGSAPNIGAFGTAGSTPPVAITPSPVAFPNQTVSIQSSPPLTVTVSNTGSATLTLNTQ